MRSNDLMAINGNMLARCFALIAFLMPVGAAIGEDARPKVGGVCYF